MKRPLKSAALLFAFVGAQPVFAQGLAQARETGSSAAEQGPPAQTSLRQNPPGGALFATNSGLGLSRNSFTEEDGSQSLRRGLIGSWDITPGVRAGIGLFTVTADGRKQAEQRRMQNVRDVGVREERVAAVGMSLRF